MKFPLLAALTVAAFSSISAPAVGHDGWQPTFRSEREIFLVEGDKAVSYIRQEYGLKPGFSAQQFGDAVSEKVIRTLRRDYQLGPNFTSAEIAANYGAQRVADLTKHYELSTNFTADDLRAAKAKRRYLSWTNSKAGPRYPFSADDYARYRGREETEKLTTYYRLPTNWVYSDLVAAAGPARASDIRHENGFSKNATHIEIVMAIGHEIATRFAKDNDLPVGFTADQMESGKGFVLSKYDEFASLPAIFTEADLVDFYGARKIGYLRHDYGLPAAFTEAELRSAVSATAIASLQRQYDLGSNFSEEDIRQAAGLSRALEQRNAYELRPDFSVSEFEAAYKRRQEQFKGYRYDSDNPFVSLN